VPFVQFPKIRGSSIPIRESQNLSRASHIWIAEESYRSDSGGDVAKTDSLDPLVARVSSLRSRRWLLRRRRLPLQDCLGGPTERLKLLAGSESSPIIWPLVVQLGRGKTLILFDFGSGQALCLRLPFSEVPGRGIICSARFQWIWMQPC
jgi:hypothetical protein